MPISRNDVLQDHDSHPLVLDLLLTKDLGPEWWLWEPETLREAISRQYHLGCSELVWNKLQALRTVHVAPGLVFDEWEVFLPVITALNNIIPDFNVLQLPTPARLYAGVGMLRTLDPQEKFSDEVTKFIVCALLHEGIYYAPGELSFAQDLLRRPYYVCPDCGFREEVLFDHDGVCNSCGRDWYSKASGLTIKDPKVQMFYRHDIDDVKERFNKVAQDWESFHPHDDDPIDVQVCKVASAIEYKARRDAQFIEQKEALGL